MLVLSRKPGETILIGETIVITVVRVKGDNVRIGISAPRDIPIARSELLREVPPVAEASTDVEVT